MDKEELKTLLEKAHAGDIKARNKIIEENLGLVGFINSKMGNTEDGFQDGILGLCKAIEKYNYSEETKLGTYAYFWIKQSIQRKRERECYRGSYPLIELVKKYKKCQTPEEIKKFIKDNKIKQEKLIRIENAMLKEKVLEDWESGDKTDFEEDVLTKEIVRKLIAKYCNKQEKEFIYRHYYLGQTETEIARSLDLTKQRINMIKHTLLSKLRRGYAINNY